MCRLGMQVTIISIAIVCFTEDGNGNAYIHMYIK